MRVRDRALAIISSGQVDEESLAWIKLHVILHEAQAQIVYRRRCGRDDRDARTTY